MERIEKTIEVEAPLRAVYNQWTQFEEFPRFMDGVKEVRQLDDTHVHWHAEIWGKDKDWDAEITEQEPDTRVSWRSVSGAPNAGTVRFQPLEEFHRGARPRDRRLARLGGGRAAPELSRGRHELESWRNEPPETRKLVARELDKDISWFDASDLERYVRKSLAAPIERP